MLPTLSGDNVRAVCMPDVWSLSTPSGQKIRINAALTQHQETPAPFGLFFNDIYVCGVCERPTPTNSLSQDMCASSKFATFFSLFK